MAGTEWFVVDKWQGLIKHSLLAQDKGLVMLPDSFKKESDMIRLSFLKNYSGLLGGEGWKLSDLLRRCSS